jgi:hypothetical protein
MIVGPTTLMASRFALRNPRPTSEDSNLLSPGGLGTQPCLGKFPSIIYPTPDWGSGCWHMKKFTYGPTSTDLAHALPLGFKTGTGIGRHNGHEDYAD